MSINQGSLITATDVNNHINDKNNPHGITAASIGAASSSDIAALQAEINNLKANLSPSCKSGSLTFSGRHSGSTISTPSGTTIKYIILKLNAVGWYDNRNPGSVNLGYQYEIRKDATYSGNFQIYSDGNYTVTAQSMKLSGNSFSYDYIQLKKTGLSTYFTGQINYEIYYS